MIWRLAVYICYCFKKKTFIICNVRTLACRHLGAWLTNHIQFSELKASEPRGIRSQCERLINVRDAETWRSWVNVWLMVRSFLIIDCMSIFCSRGTCKTAGCNPQLVSDLNWERLFIHITQINITFFVVSVFPRYNQKSLEHIKSQKRKPPNYILAGKSFLKLIMLWIK